MSPFAKVKRIGDYLIAVLLTAIAYPLGRMFYANKGIWLIGERPWQAQDNGFAFYRYVKEKHPERRAYYVIKKRSPQLKKFDKTDRIIYHGSFQHWLMYYGCEAVISAQIRSLLPSDNWRYKMLATAHKQTNKKQVFLQHGVIHADIESSYRERTRVDLFICGAKPEYDYVKANFHYRNGEVKYTGLARYDALHDTVTKKQILIMPTWRRWLVKEGCDLEHSEYVREWNKVLTDKRLIDAAKRAGCSILFYPHSELQSACDLFQSMDDAVIIARDSKYEVQPLLKESAILITDHSSVFFDFAYMRKPVLYFQFDNDDYYARHYPKGYYDFERDGFGKLTYEASRLVDCLVESIESGFALTEEYNKRIDRFFPLYDRNNCERIYREVVSLLDHT